MERRLVWSCQRRGAAARFAAVDAYVRAQMENAGIPGLTLGVVQDGRPVHLAGFG